MQKIVDKRDRLVPLRRFSDTKLYSTAYLSVLVQRKKLKAQKAGRIYYTCQAWFEDYLDTHAREEIRTDYYRNKNLKIDNQNNLNNNLTALDRGGFFVVLKNNWFKAVGLGLGVLILVALVVNTIVVYDSGQGRVSGISESSNSVGSSTILMRE